MPDQTTNYELKKPLQSENYNIQVQNDNMDAIDAALADYKRGPGYAADSGTADAYVVTLSPAAIAYAAGMGIRFKAANANTGACTVNVNGLGAKSIKMDNGTDPPAGMIAADAIVTVVYDGTNFQVVAAGIAAHLADNTKHATAWATWTPTLTWTTATPEGSPSTLARYCTIGKTVFFKFQYVATDGNGATNLNISLPVAPKDIGGHVNPIESIQMVNTTYSDPHGYVRDALGALYFKSFAICTDGQAIDISCSGHYEIA